MHMARGVEDHEVCVRALLQGPHIETLEGARGAGGGRPHGLCGRHPHRGHRERDDHRHVGREARPGVAVGGESDGRAGVEQRARVRPGRSGREVGDRHERRHDTGLRERLGVARPKVREVIGARGAELRGEPRARTGFELVRMDPEAQATLLGRGQDRTRLVLVEGAALAEHIRPAGERRARVEHLAAHQVDVLVGFAGVFRRHDVSTEERHVVGELTRERQQPRLVVDVQAVPGLDLDVRGSRAERFVAQAPGVRPELVVARRTRGRDRRSDPARLVALASHPGVELGGPIAREHEMRVAVDEPRQRGTAAGVDAWTVDALGHSAPRADPGDPLAVDRDRGVADDAERAVACRIVRDELADVLDEHYASAIGTRTPRSAATASARSYPASTCRRTPIPGSFVSTRSALRAASSVPSTTTTCPAWMERPIPTPPPWWMLTHDAPLAVLTSAFSSGQSAIASEPSAIDSVSRYGDATLPASRWSRPITIGAWSSPRATMSLNRMPRRWRSP